MRQLINRFIVMLKRTVLQPVYIGMLAALLLLGVLYMLLPNQSRSLDIPVAVYCEDTSPEAQALMEQLTGKKSAIRFYTVQDMETLKTEVVSGHANSGFYIPAHYVEEVSMGAYEKKITEYVTESTIIPRVVYESLYSRLFYYVCYGAVLETLGRTNGIDAPKEELSEKLSQVYQSFDQKQALFSSNIAENEAGEIMKEELPVELPIKKMAGLFIFIAAIIGAGAYIRDKENHLYLLLSLRDRTELRLVHVLVSILPLAVTGFLMIVLTGVQPVLPALTETLLYVPVVAVYAILFGICFRSSKAFNRFLPVWLVLTIIFSGVFFDLGSYNTAVHYAALLFPPYYF